MRTLFIGKDGRKYTMEDSELVEALRSIAAKMRENALAVRNGNYYASHVTECQKDENLRLKMALADKAERGEFGTVATFWCQQRLEYELEGTCTALLPKY